MQYLLTEKEHTDLINQVKEANKLPNLVTLQKVCTNIANNYPIKFWGRKEATPWGCVISDEDEWYCDECPVQKICPYEYKGWSK